MKRILHVVGCLERGGTEAFIMNHYRCLNREAYQFDFLVLRKKDYPYEEEIKQLGGRIFFVTAPSISKISTFLREAIAVMETEGPFCAVHSHVNIENAWIMVAAAKAGIPVRVAHSHDTIGKEGRLPVFCYRLFQEKLIKRYATDYLACSIEAGNYLYGERFFKCYGKVIHNGIDVESFSVVSESRVAALREAFGLKDEDGPIIGNITRFEPKKNQLFAVDIFSEVLKKRPQAILILGGPDGGNLDTVKEIVRERNLDQQVRFIGPRDDVPDCLKLMDVYLFPSLYEGLGIVLLEAQASGCYCVASGNVPGEVDMGLGLMSFMDLAEPAERWAECILKHDIRQYDQEHVRAAFEAKGYAIRQSMDALLNIYGKR